MGMFVPVVPVLAAFYLMLNLPGATWVRLVWMALGFAFCFVHGARHSLATDPNYSREADTAAAEKRKPDPQY
jgi:APA family basic amino acid/polyamine antiporter